MVRFSHFGYEFAWKLQYMELSYLSILDNSLERGFLQCDNRKTIIPTIIQKNGRCFFFFHTKSDLKQILHILNMSKNQNVHLPAVHLSNQQEEHSYQSSQKAEKYTSRRPLYPGCTVLLHPYGCTHPLFPLLAAAAALLGLISNSHLPRCHRPSATASLSKRASSSARCPRPPSSPFTLLLRWKRRLSRAIHTRINVCVVGLNSKSDSHNWDAARRTQFVFSIIIII